jgi:hypothetical protein
MIVSTPLPVALLPPPADIAMIDGLGVSPAGGGFHRLLQRPFDDAIIRRKRSQTIRLRLEASVRPDDVEEFRLQALQCREELGVVTQLKNGLRLRFTCQLAIHSFVRPIAGTAVFFALLNAQ